MFNKTPKYSVNDIVIIDKGFSYEYGYSVVVGIINDVYNHRDTGEVFYHIIFNSGTPRKVFEYEIKAKFDTDRFKDGQSIHKQLLVQMYHTRSYKYLTEKEVLEWAHANFKENVDHTIYCPHSDRPAYYGYRYDPKFMGNMMYPVKSSLTALEELNKREFERVAAESIRFNIDEFKLPTKEEINAMFGVPKFEYKKIIFSRPCTIILWMDGTKTMARINKEETFDPEKGVAVCFMKRALGEIEGKKVLRKANKDFYDEITKRAEKDLKEGLTPMDEYLRGKVIFDDIAAFLRNSMLNTNAIVHVDQSTIDEVKKVEEQDD